MLNDAAKERERVMEVAAETKSLERLVGDGDRGASGTRAGWPTRSCEGSRAGAHLFPPSLLLAQVAAVSPRLEALRRSAEALARDTAQAESGFTTVKSEQDLPGLQGLQSRQQEMEVSSGSPAAGRARGGEVPGQDGAIPGRCWPPGAQVSSALARGGVWAGIFQPRPGKGRELGSAPPCQRPAASTSLIFPLAGW